MFLLGQVMVEGVLEQPLVHGKHAVELQAEKIKHVRVPSPKNYHRKLNIQLCCLCFSVTQKTLSYDTYTFFHNNGFIYAHKLVITTTDIEASSKIFQVTML